MYNKCFMVGTICTDVSHKVIESGKKVANFRMETNDPYKQFHAVNCYDRSAENAENMANGDMVFVEGRVVTRSYKDRNGDKKYITTINAARLAKIGDPSSPNTTEAGADDEF